MPSIKTMNLKNEFLAGITTSLAIIPETIAFSFVLGTGPKIGLATSFIIALLAALFGGRPGMISGAAGSVATVFIALVATHGVEYLFSAVILMGIIQILFGLFRLGKFVRMIPHPVMLGFVNGLAIIIFKAQFESFKGVHGINLLLMLALVALTMLITFLLPKLTTAIPSSLVGIIVTTVLAIFLNANGFDINTVKTIAGGSLSGTLPSFHLPHVPFTLKTLQIILPYSITAALVGLVESLLTLTLIDDITDTRGRSNREAVGQGIANTVAGFFGGMGGCAMVGQSMINISSGGRKRLSGVVTALGIIFFILFGSQLIESISMAALVGVMFMVVIETFSWESLKFGRKIPKKDLVIILIVTLVTVVQNLATAVIVGIIISSLMFAWEKGKKVTAHETTTEEQKEYHLNGPLFFASVASFKDLFDPKNDPETVIIDFSHSQVMDHSAIEAINSITQKYKENGKTLHLRHLSKDCYQLLTNAKEIIDVNILEDPTYHIADDQLDS